MPSNTRSVHLYPRLGLQVGRALARLAALAALASLAVVALAGCGGGATQGDPALPPGFLDARLPNVDLSGYIYVDPGRELGLPLSIFGEEAGGPERAGLRRLVGVMDESVQEFGARIDFADEQGPALAGGLIAEANSGPLWLQREGQRLLLVAGDTAWSGDLRGAWESDDIVGLQER